MAQKRVLARQGRAGVTPHRPLSPSPGLKSQGTIASGWSWRRWREVGGECRRAARPGVTGTHRNEDGRRERGGRDAEARRHLLRGAGIDRCHAGVSDH